MFSQKSVAARLASSIWTARWACLGLIDADVHALAQGSANIGRSGLRSGAYAELKPMFVSAPADAERRVDRCSANLCRRDSKKCVCRRRRTSMWLPTILLRSMGVTMVGQYEGSGDQRYHANDTESTGRGSGEGREGEPNGILRNASSLLKACSGPKRLQKKRRRTR